MDVSTCFSFSCRSKDNYTETGSSKIARVVASVIGLGAIGTGVCTFYIPSFGLSQTAGIGFISGGGVMVLTALCIKRMKETPPITTEALDREVEEIAEAVTSPSSPRSRASFSLDDSPPSSPEHSRRREHSPVPLHPVSLDFSSIRSDSSVSESLRNVWGDTIGAGDSISVSSMILLAKGAKHRGSFEAWKILEMICLDEASLADRQEVERMKRDLLSDPKLALSKAREKQGVGLYLEALKLLQYIDQDRCSSREQDAIEALESALLKQLYLNRRAKKISLKGVEAPLQESIIAYLEDGAPKTSRRRKCTVHHRSAINPDGAITW